MSNGTPETREENNCPVLELAFCQGSQSLIALRKAAGKGVSRLISRLGQGLAGCCHQFHVDPVFGKFRTRMILGSGPLRMLTLDDPD